MTTPAQTAAEPRMTDEGESMTAADEAYDRLHGVDGRVQTSGLKDLAAPCEHTWDYSNTPGVDICTACGDLRDWPKGMD